MNDKTIDIEKRISEARKRNYAFDRFVITCESSIHIWADKIRANNDTPCIVPTKPRDSAQTRISILLPVVPISPNETDLLLKYLTGKYLKCSERVIGGDYLKLRKCLFKDNYKLSSHYYDA